MALTVHARVAWQVLDGKAVLIDLERSTALGFNATGSFLWERLPGSTPEDLAAALTGAFAVEQSQADTEVAGFLELLRARGYVEG